MEAEKLRKTIAKALKGNPDLYREAVVPALIDSELSCIEVFGGYAEAVHIELPKTLHKRMFNLESQQKFNRERLNQWKKEGQRIFTCDDFPEWVKDRLTEVYGDAQSMVRLAAQENMTLNVSLLPPVSKDLPDNFCVVDGKAYFTDRGYCYLIMASESRWNLFGFERKRWMADCGLYDKESLRYLQIPGI